MVVMYVKFVEMVNNQVLVVGFRVTIPVLTSIMIDTGINRTTRMIKLVIIL